MRKPLVNCSPSGDFPVVENLSPEEKRKALFQGTYFQASLDASDPEKPAWSRQSGETHQWQTQRQQITRSMQLLGVDPDLKDGLRELIAETLDVPLLFLRDCCAAIMKRPGFRSRGEAVVRVLVRMMETFHGRERHIFQRLAVSGSLIGIWCSPMLCHPQNGHLHSLSFSKMAGRPPPS